MSRVGLAGKTLTNWRRQIPISQGGAAFAWNSPLVLVMLSLGAAMILIFLLVEWRFAKLPIMPRESMLSICQRKSDSCFNGLEPSVEIVTK